MHLSLLTLRDRNIEHLKDRSNNAQNRRSGELSSHLFETYKNSVRPHGCHIYNSAADMDMVKMCPCPSQKNGLPQCKCVLSCCDKCPVISISHQETDMYDSTVS